jgi:exodeoxyribonuclease VII large subunit
LTGIGHERDDSVADQVAYQKFKTPTAVADFLINKLVNAEEMVKEWETEITRRLQWQWQKQWDDYQKNIKECFFDFQKRLYYHEKEKSFWIQKLWQKAGFQLQKEQEKLAQVEMEIFQLNPLAILNKGYAILHQDRKRLHALQEANTQSPISITMKDGKETFRFSKS